MFKFEDVFSISALVSKEKELLGKAKYLRVKAEKIDDDLQKSSLLSQAEELEVEAQKIREEINNRDTK